MNDVIANVVRTSFGKFLRHQIQQTGNATGIYIELLSGYVVTVVLDGENVGKATIYDVLYAFGGETDIRFSHISPPVGVRVQPTSQFWADDSEETDHVLQLYIEDLPIVTLTGCNWFKDVDVVNAGTEITGTWLEMEGEK